MPRYIVDELATRGIKQHETTDLDSVVKQSDVLYVTRVQKVGVAVGWIKSHAWTLVLTSHHVHTSQERFESEDEYNAVKDSFVITCATIADAKKSMVLMHPLPRVGEIAEEVDADPRAAYFRQMENGMYVRMALLALVLGKA